MALSLLTGTIKESGRNFPFWIDAWLELTSGTQSPEIFRIWAGVMAIAGVLEMRVWIKVTNWRPTYPHMYILLIGGPGVGKTEAIREIISVWSDLPDIHVAPSSVSRASLIDELNLAKREIPTLDDPLNPFMRFNSLQIATTELGTFLVKYENEFMSTLNDLYDNVPYKESKRHMKGTSIVIPKPQLNLIAGTTPGWLGTNLPEVVWQEGFSSRLMLVFSGERIKVDPWAAMKSNEEMRLKLVSDLVSMLSMRGCMSWEPDVAEAFRAWYMADCAPVPNHPKLEHYIPRRHVHLLKLLIIMSASRSNDMVIRMEDYQAAMDLFLLTEAYMPDVFKSMKSADSNANVIDECFNYVWTIFAKENKPVSQHRIVNFLAQKLPTYAVMKTLEIMISSGMLTVIPGGGVGGRDSYKPTPKSTHEV